MHVIGPPTIPRHHITQQHLVRTRPRSRPRPRREVPHVLFCDLDRRRLVIDQHIDHAIGRLYRDRPNVRGSEHAQPPALDHRRPAHPHIRFRRRHNHVATPQQRRVAGKAPSRHDADQRHLPAQTGEQRKRIGVQPGHDRHVGVARPTAAALGEQHDGQRQAGHELEQAVLLLVVHLALGAGQHGVVVRQHRHRLPVDATDPGHQPIRRRALDQLGHTAPGPLRRHHQRPVLLETAGVAQVRQVLPRRAAAAFMSAGHDIRTTFVGGEPDPFL